VLIIFLQELDSRKQTIQNLQSVTNPGPRLFVTRKEIRRPRSTERPVAVLRHRDLFYALAARGKSVQKLVVEIGHDVWYEEGAGGRGVFCGQLSVAIVHRSPRYPLPAQPAQLHRFSNAALQLSPNRKLTT
jgi:hypothetical protein